MNSIITTADEAKALAIGSKTVIVLPVKPQPEMIVMSKDAHVAFEIFNGPNSNVNWAYKGCVYTPWPSCFIKLCASLQVGQRIYVREPYREVWLGKIEWVMYEADKAEDDEMKYYSGARMPKSAARMVIIPTDVQVKRVQDLSESDIVGNVGHDFNSMIYTQGKRDTFNGWVITKYGQAAWDNNIWVYVGTVKTEMI